MSSVLEPYDRRRRQTYNLFQAFFVFWRDIGHHMGLKDIPSTLDELKDWSEVRPIISFVWQSLDRGLTLVVFNADTGL